MTDSSAHGYPVLPGLYGFKWGPMTVVRAFDHRGYVALDIHTDVGKKITVYVSPTGRSLRVFGGGEWKPTKGDA